MKPLVMYCRWQSATLRLRGREKTAVFGHLVYTENDAERSQPFHFNLQTNELTLEKENGSETLVLDGMGVPVEQ